MGRRAHRVYTLFLFSNGPGGKGITLFVAFCEALFGAGGRRECRENRDNIIKYRSIL